MPSLHVAYPLLMIIEGWRQHGRAGRLPLFLFYFSMCFAATYLDHHWVLDILAGSAYACVVGWFMRLIIPRALPVAARDKLPAEAAE
jgi:membrane-associated phospholipid phosphatase